MQKQAVIVRKIERHSADIVTVYFTLADGGVLAYEAGQYVTVYFQDTTTPEGKAYSLCTAPYESLMGITVKRIGEYSGRLHDLKVGDAFDISSAYGFFNPGHSRPLVCLAAGVGISPIWSVLKSELLRDASLSVHLFYSNKRAAEIPHGKVINQLVASRESFKASYHVTGEATVPGAMRQGRIVLDECVGAVEDACYLVCGSVEFVTAMVRGLVVRGVEQTRISTETFFES